MFRYFLLGLALCSVPLQLHAEPIPKGMRDNQPFPTTVGTKWVYQLSDGPESTCTITITKARNKGDHWLIEKTCEFSNGRNPDVYVMKFNAKHAETIENTSRQDLDYRDHIVSFHQYKLKQTWTATVDVLLGGNGRLTYAYTYTVLEKEKIKVQFGEVEAHKLQVDVTQAGRAYTNYHEWFVVGVGLVKQDASALFTGDQVSKELISYKVGHNSLSQK